MVERKYCWFLFPKENTVARLWRWFRVYVRIYGSVYLSVCGIDVNPTFCCWLVLLKFISFVFVYILWFPICTRPAPHAKALLNGIDSLTIQAKISSEDNTIGKSIGERIDTILYGIEHLTRGLNSLQELLHHNVNQYIMVSTTKFVSFDEYLIPNILILLPLVNNWR